MLKTGTITGFNVTVTDSSGNLYTSFSVASSPAALNITKVLDKLNIYTMTNC